LIVLTTTTINFDTQLDTQKALLQFLIPTHSGNNLEEVLKCNLRAAYFTQSNFSRSLLEEGFWNVTWKGFAV
jgi:hypothetical protein